MNQLNIIITVLYLLCVAVMLLGVFLWRLTRDCTINTNVGVSETPRTALSYIDDRLTAQRENITAIKANLSKTVNHDEIYNFITDLVRVDNKYLKTINVEMYNFFISDNARFYKNRIMYTNNPNTANKRGTLVCVSIWKCYDISDEIRASGRSYRLGYKIVGDGSVPYKVFMSTLPSEWEPVSGTKTIDLE